MQIDNNTDYKYHTIHTSIVQVIAEYFRVIWIRAIMSLPQKDIEQYPTIWTLVEQMTPFSLPILLSLSLSLSIFLTRVSANSSFEKICF